MVIVGLAALVFDNIHCRLDIKGSDHGSRIKALIPEPEKKKFTIVRYKIIS